MADERDPPLGTVAVGTTHERSFTFRNDGSLEAVVKDVRLAAGDPNGFSVAGGTCVSAGRIAPDGGKCSVIVRYTATMPASISATVRLVYNWTNSGMIDQSVAVTDLWAEAHEGVSVTNEDGEFEAEMSYLWQPLGITARKELVITNYTPTAIVLGSITRAGLGLAASFDVSAGTCTTGATLPSLQSCTLAITFSPAGLGGAQSSFAIPYTPAGGAATQSVRVNVSGAGVSPLAFSDAVRLQEYTTFDFGSIALGSSATRVLKLVNWLPEEIELGALTTSSWGLASPFDYVGRSCAPGTILRGAGVGTCTLDVTFTSSRLSRVEDTLQLQYRQLQSGTSSAARLTLYGAGRASDPVQALYGGGYATCARLESGNVRCWGPNDRGQLGYGDTQVVGDDETPAERGNLNVGGRVVQMALGIFHSCALLDTGKVRCWGLAQFGALGYGNTNSIGDDEAPATAGDVDVGGRVVQVGAGNHRTCALLDTGNVRCWGSGALGTLGYGNTRDIGDNEVPASAGDLNIGGKVVQLVMSDEHTCVLLANGRVRCWGVGSFGRLGYGDTQNIGDNEFAGSGGDVDVGGTVVQLAAGWRHNCALLTTGKLRCWGENQLGTTGYASPYAVGDNETPASVGDVPLEGQVQYVGINGDRACAWLTTGAVRCWGSSINGSLGYPGRTSMPPAEAPDVRTGAASITQLMVGPSNTCVLATDGAVRCWGRGDAGLNGIPGSGDIGDDEYPSNAPDVSVQ
ncbi:MAG TPA: choice-of-anchor D domain-containing protein [Polyangiaceae bacterium]|nr:choice-of-anchor D domain-containing protein [Polyangiaceae bacterium]